MYGMQIKQCFKEHLITKVKHTLATWPSNLVPKYLPLSKLQSSGKIQPGLFVYILFLAVFCYNRVELQQTVGLQSIYYLVLYRKSLPTSTLEKRKLRLTQNLYPMLIAALFIITKTGTNPNVCPLTGGCINEPQYIPTMLYHSTIKRNKLWTHTIIWIKALSWMKEPSLKRFHMAHFYCMTPSKRQNSDQNIDGWLPWFIWGI